MSSNDKDELLRKFEAAISGMELSDLRQLAGNLTMFTGRLPRPAGRPDLRRPRLTELAIYRIRVDLDHAQPPIWRRLDLRSDLPLDVVHQVLQVAFDWTDSHLHRFSLGGHPFDGHSQLFLCPYDFEEGEFEDEGGIAATDEWPDETLQEAGDVLHYLYDYGDSWELTFRLEDVLPATDDAPSAIVVDGRRAAPPEDCGGITDAESLAEVLDDPARFDVDETNEALRNPYFVLREYGVDHRLIDLVNRLSYTSIGEDLATRMMTLVLLPTEPSPQELEESLRAHRWFLDRAKGGGIELTSAGYLKPADVEAASRVVPAMGDWIGKNNRESLAAPLLDFRQTLQSMGLLRKYKGTLLLTRAGAAAQKDPGKLRDLLASRLLPTAEGFDTDATLLLLAYAATSADAKIPLKNITEALGHLGWRHLDGRPLEDYELYRLAAFDVLINVSERSAELGDRRRISPAAAALAWTALRQR
ncbi:MAG: plasmid pRiA4b ORF-3 family protein [Nocardioidaceae bacterium]